MRSIDPARMTNDAILAELGELLAVGYERRIITSMRHPMGDQEAQKELDVLTKSEARCAAQSKRKSRCRSPKKSQS